MRSPPYLNYFVSFLSLCSFSRAQFLDNTDRNWIGGISFCGCRDCTRRAYTQQAGGHSCGDRILNLIFERGMTEEDACRKVAGEEFPGQCGPACDPDRCDGRDDDPAPIPVLEIIRDPAPVVANKCNCPSCTPEVWNRLVGTPAYTCGARIEFLQKANGLDPIAACYEVAEMQFPEPCGLCNPNSCRIQADPESSPATGTVTSSHVEALPVSTNEVPTRCGCTRCTENVLNSMANGYRCSERIDYLLKTSPHLYPREEDACHQVANEFPNICGPQCDPSLCHGMDEHLSGNNALVVNAPNVGGRSYDMDLYCFPPIESRKKYDNVWGKYAIQVKSADKPCGPSENVFSTRTVSVANNKRDLKLQFKKVGNEWHASEVRILLPEAQMPFDYGSYSFSVKSVKVIDSRTESLISTVLPPSLVLGLFTWDPLEDFTIHENMNHEVDVEISRWDDPDNADAQFLVQPPGHPQKKRFYTGKDFTYQQAPRIYGFDWRPTEVEWYSNAGPRGQRFTYSTQDALDAGQIDYNQCMPANVEVRINLWNLGGIKTPPTDMKDTHVAEVVIDSFQYLPSGRSFVADGHVCSKDCHCESSSRCISNRCTSTTTASRRNRGGTRRKQRRMQSPLERNTSEEGGPSLLVVQTAPAFLIALFSIALLLIVVLGQNFAASKASSSDSSLQ